MKFLNSLLFSFSIAFSQNLDSTSTDIPKPDEYQVKPARLAVIGGSIAVSYATFYYALLKDGWWNEVEPFRFEPLYSDNHYASNLDKFGHFYAGSVIGELLVMSYDWAGMDPFASTLWAGITVGVTQIIIEFKDGFSPYGYSVWDAVAGTLGGFYAMGKRFIPAMQYVDYKFAYWPNSNGYWDEYKKRGETGIWFDDYYGGNQTHWLSFKVAKMLPSQAREYYPEWLAFAIGWGLHDVYGGPNWEAEWDKVRYGYYFSLDYDFEAIFCPQKTWSRNLIAILNRIKFPAPAVRLHPDAKFFPLHPWYGFSVNF
ncbi:MAG: YfiM family protein [Fibromonadales bacterium]|nr:YfiM family protein [Fibromonadales bacterium]